MMNAPLIESMMTDCVMMDRITSGRDDQGGFVYDWAEGASFKAAIIKNNSLTARVAEKQGVSELYMVTTNRGVTLDFHDVFKRVKDGAIFRVTSNVTDSETPDVATFQFGQVTAERWQLV